MADEITYSKSAIDVLIRKTREVNSPKRGRAGKPDEYCRGWNNALDRLSNSLFVEEEMQKPDVRTLGNLTIREMWNICSQSAVCEQCRLYNSNVCFGWFGAFPEEDLDKEVEL